MTYQQNWLIQRSLWLPGHNKSQLQEQYSCTEKKNQFTFPPYSYKLPKDKDATAMVVGLGFDVSVCEEEYGEYNGDDVPARENQSRIITSTVTQHIIPRHST